MIGYVTLGTNDREKSAKFYDALCGELGVGRMMDNEQFIAWGKPDGGAGIGEANASPAQRRKAGGLVDNARCRGERLLPGRVCALRFQRVLPAMLVLVDGSGHSGHGGCLSIQVNSGLVNSGVADAHRLACASTIQAHTHGFAFSGAARLRRLRALPDGKAAHRNGWRGACARTGGTSSCARCDADHAGCDRR